MADTTNVFNELLDEGMAARNNCVDRAGEDTMFSDLAITLHRLTWALGACIDTMEKFDLSLEEDETSGDAS